MRLAFFVHRFPQLSEAFIIDQAAALIAQGHEVDIYAVWGQLPANPLQFPVVESAGLMRRCRHPGFHVAGLPRLRGGLALALTAFRGRLRVLGGALNPRRGRWAFNLRLLYEAAMLDGRGPYDVVHCQFADLAPVVLSLRGIGAFDAPVAVHVRGIDITRRPREMGAEAYARIFAGGDLFLANCDYFRERARALGCPAEKLVVFRSAIDLQGFAYRGPRPPGDPCMRLAFVGRLVEKKGLRYAIEALARVRRAGVEAELTVLGDGPLLPELRALGEAEGLAGHLRFVGAGGRSEVLDLLRRSDVLLAPSVRAQDGDEDAPVNTLKEAMALGLPVVATRHGGIPELVRDGDNGLLVPERDTAALATALQWLGKHRHRWGAMGEQGRRAVEAEYELQRQTARLVQMDRLLVARWQGGRT